MILTAVAMGSLLVPSVSIDGASQTSGSLMDRLVGSWVLQGTIAGKQTTHDVDAEWVLNHGYVRMHEVSRERTAAGAPAYEAIVFIGLDAKTGQYSCLWLDSTSSQGLSAGTTCRAMASGDSIPFVFQYANGDVFRTTFIYERSADTWRWTLDADEHGQLRPFARVTLTRRQP